jgi:hypothetical protein
VDLVKDHKCICEQCKIGSTESKPTGKGKETIFRLLNVQNKSVDKYVVDDCLLKRYREEEKCDYLFKIDCDKIAFLVECKGSDIVKATRQLSSSLKLLKKSLIDIKIKGRIVSTRTFAPDLRDRNYSSLREELDGDLLVKNKIIEEKI